MRNEWAATVLRIIPQDEVGQWGSIDAGDARAELLLEGRGLERDKRVEQAGAHGEEAMQPMLAETRAVSRREPALLSA